MAVVTVTILPNNDIVTSNAAMLAADDVKTFLTFWAEQLPSIPAGGSTPYTSQTCGPHLVKTIFANGDAQIGCEYLTYATLAQVATHFGITVPTIS